MADAYVQNAKRRRKYGTRVKTGCITCRIRRVKCDETKPSCQRCTSTGRTCDGYGDRNPIRSPAESSLGSLSPPREAILPQENRAIEYFFYRVCPRVSGFFENDRFWREIALQFSHNEPAVRNAVFAVSSVYEQTDKSDGSPVFANDKFALQSYNNAIRHLVDMEYSDGERRTVTTLMTCLLFICLEFMRGDISAAQSHIRSGSSILKMRRRTDISEDGPSSPSSLSSSSLSSFPRTLSGLVDDSDALALLSTQFSRLRLQSVFFDPEGLATMVSAEVPFDLTPLKFTSLAAAREYHYKLSMETTSLIYSTACAKYSNSVTMEQIFCQVRLETQFKDWRKAFKTFFESWSSTWTQREIDAANVLLIQSIVMYIWVATCLSPEESSFDKFRSEFEAIIGLASEIVSNSRENLRFHLEMGVIPSLHFIGSKCRFPVLRRQILKILGSSHWREGMFDSFRSFRYVHKIMEVEEAGAPTAYDIDTKNLWSGLAVNEGMPPESARIHIAELGPLVPLASQQKLTLVFMPKSSPTQPIVSQLWIPTEGELPVVQPWFSS